ncbi:UNVERIFIED_CONTAM: AP-2 complex subunit beta [Siphonaria sp. JEL0065]|nr:AP-2 complex subunit beta [Siphonaria sp. JEL0065]
MSAFTTEKKGEAYELRVDLNSEYREKRKETVKKVIANMTIGKDVSGLFADVVKNMQTEDIELKKLVYLYLINYAKTQPELVILAVNTFLKDTDDINPLIRALAIRTLGCLRVEKVVDYLMEPLKKSLKDDDPYVRKTSALCVAKIFDLNPAICIDNGLISSLQEMLSDRNPMVIANAVSALSEIHAHSPQDQIFVITPQILTKLLAALNECTEWGQIVILESLATYKPTPGSREPGEIVERVIARLQHANASVVLAAVKVLMIYVSYIDSDLTKQVMKKMAPPLVTLLASDPEIQYVALRNINLILQRHPQILSSEIRVFFTKYNDPLYVKLEKLESIIKLVSLDSIDQVLLELREYASEVDVEFVRRSVRAIGRCAIKLDGASEKCVNVLLDLIKTRVSYVLQEAVVVIKDVFRKYPKKYEGVIPALCENLEALEEPEAKAALVWIIGEYAERIENAEELVEYFVEGFKDESAKVQLQLLTATVKLFLKKPGSAQELVQKILQLATQGCENPDIRDRAYIYWRLLSSNPQAAKAVVLAEKPPIESDNSTVSETLLEELIYHIGSLASVYHKPAALLGVRGDVPSLRTTGGDDEDATRVDVQKVVASVGGNIENLLDLDFGTPAVMPVAATPGAHRPSNVDDLLGMDLGGNDGGLLGGLAGSVTATGASSTIETPKAQLLTPDTAQGLDLTGSFVKRNGQLALDLHFSNKSVAPMSDFAIQFNVNSYGITPSAALQVPVLSAGQSANVALPLNRSGAVAPHQSNTVQIAIKNSNGVYYFQVVVTDERVVA